MPRPIGRGPRDYRIAEGPAMETASVARLDEAGRALNFCGMKHRQRLRSLLVERSLTLGDFTLASGDRSSYYIDARLTTMSAEGQALVGIVGYQALQAHDPFIQWVGGLTLGADPVSYAIAHRSWLEENPVGAFTVRKQPKAHGTAGRIEGGLPSGARVLIVEDTLTTGASALAAIEAVRGHGAWIAGVLTLVDREAGGTERLREAGFPVVSLFTAAELLASPEDVQAP